jgi:RimJ/RimL family protein N-acetyltransferase
VTESVDVRLVVGTLATFDAELGGDLAGLAEQLGVAPIEEWPPRGGEHDAEAVSFFRTVFLEQPEAASWLAYYVCAGPLLVGSAGFMGPPHDGVAEIGYSICERYRRRGHATSAVRALTRRADDAGVRTLIARTAPGNAASMIVLERNGFVRTGPRDDGSVGFARAFPA